MSSQTIFNEKYRKVVITTPDKDTFLSAQEFLINKGFRLPGHNVDGERCIDYTTVEMYADQLGLVVFPSGIDNPKHLFMYTSNKYSSLSSAPNTIEVSFQQVMLEDVALNDLPLARL